MNRSYFEAFFRHKYLLCLPIVLGLIVGAGLAFRSDRDYTAAASFWADTPVTQESTNGTTGGASPPSAGESTYLTQMLATHTFMRSVVEASPLADKFNGLDNGSDADKVEADRMLTSVGSNILVTANGPQLVSVTVTRKSSDEATGLAKAVLDKFQEARTEQAVNRAKAEVDHNRLVLDAAQRSGQGSTDSNVERRLSDAQTAYDQANVALQAAQTNGLQIVDHPDLAIPKARMMTIAIGGIGGMMAGFTVSLITLILLMARDQSIRNERDATKALGLQVVGSVPNEKWKGAGGAPPKEPSSATVGNLQGSEVHVAARGDRHRQRRSRSGKARDESQQPVVVKP